MNETTTEVKRFDIKTEAKVMKALGNILASAPGISEEEALGTENLNVLDPANVAMVIPISEEAKRTVARFVDKDIHRSNVPKLNYEHGHSSKYSTTYLASILKIFSVWGESVRITVAGDFPATFENEHFKIILAPRVEND